MQLPRVSRDGRSTWCIWLMDISEYNANGAGVLPTALCTGTKAKRGLEAQITQALDGERWVMVWGGESRGEDGYWV